MRDLSQINAGMKKLGTRQRMPEDHQTTIVYRWWMFSQNATFDFIVSVLPRPRAAHYGNAGFE